MQGQRYAYMTPSMARADGGGTEKSNQVGKGETRQQRENKDNLMHEGNLCLISRSC